MSRTSVGRTTARTKPKGGAGGKSGLHGHAVPDNIRRVQAQGKCHRERDRRGALRIAAARVKRCGKSAPRRRQRRRHGKPHREQDRIGTARDLRASEGTRDRCPDPAVRVGCWRRRATGVPDEGSSRAGNRVDRTRLTGRLILTRARPDTPTGPSPISLTSSYRRRPRSGRRGRHA
jgi:hypothetical protein